MMGVEVVSPVMGKLGENSVPLAAFTMNRENEITSCPKRRSPLKTRSKDDNHTALLQLDRLTGFKNLRVRRLLAVSFAAYLKAAGIDIIRAAAFRKREKEEESALIAAFSMLSCALKERVQQVSAAIRHWISLRLLNMQFRVLYAV